MRHLCDQNAQWCAQLECWLFEHMILHSPALPYAYLPKEWSAAQSDHVTHLWKLDKTGCHCCKTASITQLFSVQWKQVEESSIQLSCLSASCNKPKKEKTEEGTTVRKPERDGLKCWTKEHYAILLRLLKWCKQQKKSHNSKHYTVLIKIWPMSQ